MDRRTVEPRRERDKACNIWEAAELCKANAAERVRERRKRREHEGKLQT